MPTMITEPALSWESQVCQYPTRGPKGISYFRGECPDGEYVDCLLFRDKSGKVRGILNHYPNDMPLEKKGNVNLYVHRKFQRRGIGSKLLAEADRRWSLNFEQQRFTPEGWAFVQTYITRKEKAPR